MLIGLQDWIHLLVLPFAHEIRKGEEELEMGKIVKCENFPGFQVEPNNVNSKYFELNHYISGTARDNYCIGAPRVFTERLATRATRDSSNPGGEGKRERGRDRAGKRE